MFDRKGFKAKAKTQLKGNWKLSLAILTSLILTAAILQYFFIFASGSNVSGVFAFFFTIAFFILQATIIITLINFFLALSKNKIVSLQTFLEGFSLWAKGVCASLWMGLWIFLWMLLFYVPGIVKAFAYSQTYFVLAENPKLGVKKALKLSIEMTKGYKGDLFVMMLSFIGWMLLVESPIFITSAIAVNLVNQKPMIFLGFALFMILVLPLSAYMITSFANTYQYLKKRAIETKALKEEDFFTAEETTKENID